MVAGQEDFRLVALQFVEAAGSQLAVAAKVQDQAGLARGRLPEIALVALLVFTCYLHLFHISLLLEEGFCLQFPAARHVEQVVLGDVKAPHTPQQHHHHPQDQQAPQPFEQPEGLVGREHQKQGDDQGADAGQVEKGLPQGALFQVSLVELLYQHQDAAADNQPQKDGEHKAQEGGSFFGKAHLGTSFSLNPCITP